MRKPLLSRSLFVFQAACLVCLFAVTLPAQEANSASARLPLVEDGTSHRIIFSKPADASQAAQLQREPRYWQQYFRQNQWKFTPANSNSKNNKEFLGFGPHFRGLRTIERDWAVSLGAGGVAEGTYPAKYTFNVYATPSCTADYAVFPISASTGYTRAHDVGTFTGAPTAGQTATITITPTGGAGVALTLTASSTLNTGLDFLISGTAGGNAENLAAAINRNLSTTPLDEIVAVASSAAGTVTVYALTAGNREVLTRATTMPGGVFAWAGVTAGANGAQANIVGLNQLYSGTAGTCGPTMNFTFPEFIFSYASGVGPVPISPTLSFDGKKVAYVENDPNIGAIFHVLTFASGSTEYGAACAASNTGTGLPTCAIHPVVPGSTATSTATDFMLPLGLVAANAATAAAGAPDNFSYPFVNYNDDTTYVGDNNGYIYSFKPTFGGTPAYAGGNFPVSLIPAPTPDTPTAVTATAGTPGLVTITVPNSLTTLESVTVSGVAAAGGGRCAAATAAAINGVQSLLSANATTITFNATITTATGGTGCTVTNAIVTPGTSYLSPATVDVGNTGNIFVGDSSGNLYMLTFAGTSAAPSVSVGSMLNGGVRGAPLVDSTNAIGFAVSACDNSGTLTGGELDTTNAALWQFSFTSSTLTKVAGAELDTAANEACTAPGFPTYEPAADERYYFLGIGDASAANNGEIIAASSGSGGHQLKIFQFVSSALQTAPLAKPQILPVQGPSPFSPLTEFWDTSTAQATVTAVTATAGTPGVVTVTAANNLAAGDMVIVSGVNTNVANGCTGADLSVISGVIQSVATATGTNFTFDPNVASSTTGTGCTVTGATVTGGPDYLFFGVLANPTTVGGVVTPELYSFLLPSGVVNNTSTNTNTTDVVNGTSAIIIDNDSNDGQASSLYYGTLGTSTTLCGAAAAFCAIKVTQGALQ